MLALEEALTKNKNDISKLCLLGKKNTWLDT
jgi:hypothetical protein